MNLPNENRLPDFISRFQDTIQPLFRFHLARCGDWLSAEALTAETLRLGRDWYLAGGLDGETPREWLFGLAIDVQARYRKARSLPPLPENELTPTPNQMECFARMAALAEAWRKLPPEQADALALTFFTGLSAEEVFPVTGVGEELLQSLAAVWQSRIGGLAAEVQPVGYFEGHLLNTLREEPPRKAQG